MTDEPLRWAWKYVVEFSGITQAFEVSERSYDRGRRCNEDTMLAAFPAREDAERHCLWLRGWSTDEIDAGEVVYVREE